jgi:hypothetical protein
MKTVFPSDGSLRSQMQIFPQRPISFIHFILFDSTITLLCWNEKYWHMLQYFVAFPGCFGNCLLPHMPPILLALTVVTCKGLHSFLLSPIPLTTRTLSQWIMSNFTSLSGLHLLCRFKTYDESYTLQSKSEVSFLFILKNNFFLLKFLWIFSLDFYDQHFAPIFSSQLLSIILKAHRITSVLIFLLS